jgi:hypothetical protein
MFHFDPQAYGPAVAPLLQPERLCELGPGRPNEAARKLLSSLTPDTLFPGRRVIDSAMARCCLAGLWLWHDFLDESHALSQEIETATGSYWHGILHRREPDAENAKYWFRRVGTHEVFSRLSHETARSLLRDDVAGLHAPPEARFLVEHSSWDPYRFIDLCQTAQSSPPLSELCRQVARTEWQLLFDFCYRRSIEI